MYDMTVSEDVFILNILLKCIALTISVDKHSLYRDFNYFSVAILTASSLWTRWYKTPLRGGPLKIYVSQPSLTHLCLASSKKVLSNKVYPDEKPHDAASHQGLRSLLTGMSVRNIINIEINILDIPNFGKKVDPI